MSGDEYGILVASLILLHFGMAVLLACGAVAFGTSQMFHNWQMNRRKQLHVTGCKRRFRS